MRKMFPPSVVKRSEEMWRSFLAQFGFTMGQQTSPIGMLSDGQKSRLVFAQVVCKERKDGGMRRAGENRAQNAFREFFEARVRAAFDFAIRVVGKGEEHAREFDGLEGKRAAGRHATNGYRCVFANVFFCVGSKDQTNFLRGWFRFGHGCFLGPVHA